MTGNDRLAEAVAEACRPRGHRTPKTHCKWGHEMTPENTRSAYRGGVLRHDCRQCERERIRDRRARDAARSASAARAARIEEIRAQNNAAGLNAFFARRRARGVPVEGTIAC